MEGNKVYVAWRSSYEEDGILGVFSTEEKAKEFMSHSTGVDCDSPIDEYDLDPGVDLSKKAYRLREKLEGGMSVGFFVINCDFVDNKTSPLSTVTYCGNWREFRVFAINKEKAIEIAKQKEKYIEENPNKFPYIGVKCNFRVNIWPSYFTIKSEYPEYDLKTGDIVASQGWEFLGPVENKESNG